MKPLIAKWCGMNTKIVVFYDDGMAVHENFDSLKEILLQIQTDLISAGLIPGVNKCIWKPVPKVDWNGLEFDLKNKTLKILDHRIVAMLKTATDLSDSWPNVTFRQVVKLVGQLNSMHPVLNGLEQLKTRNLQTIVNIRHYKNLSWDSVITADLM
jgi:hypothetical protein